MTTENCPRSVDLTGGPMPCWYDVDGACIRCEAAMPRATQRAGWEHGTKGGWGLGLLLTVKPFRVLLMLGPWAISYGRLN